jgi:hypothetical protein
LHIRNHKTRFIKIKVKEGKIQPKTGHEGPDGEQRYCSTFSLTMALNGGQWLMPHHGHFTPRKKI